MFPSACVQSLAHAELLRSLVDYQNLSNLVQFCDGWTGFDNPPEIEVILRELDSARKQMGTLGGGNHFIEIQRGSDGHIWYMIHSGSRNFGYQIAKTYNKKAQMLCEMWHSNIPASKGEDGLAFLPVRSEEGWEYMAAMNYALEFAKENRRQMLTQVGFSIAKVCNGSPLKSVTCAGEFEYLNIHHNYASLEGHFGRNVLVHRKGATSAKEGELGIIPGSQGSKSYIVRGKGNRESFMSCSHGAGRKMSRKKARKQLNLEEERKKMEDAGILHSLRHLNDLDEAASAYKDIDVVMEEQKDLVDIAVELTPLAVIKG
jgi:tRNA-splicing ligase RtcB